MKKEAPQTIHLKDYRPPDFLVDKVELTYNLFEDHAIVQSRVKYRRAVDGSNVLRLDGHDLELASISCDGQLLQEGDYKLDAEGISIEGIDTDNFTLEIETVIYPHSNTALEGLYVSNDTFCTQCESQGFRRMTYYPDRPDVMSVYTTRIEADKSRYPVLLSNGNLTDKGVLEDGRHYAVWNDPIPKPSYLFALVAGDLEHIHDNFTTMSGKTVDLYIYCRKGDESQCHHAMSSLKKAMKWDEEKFGREYDLDIYNIVAISDYNMGAMENKSLNIFNTATVLAHPDTATDIDFMRVEAVIAHEYFHNWTGNRITCRDWFQLSLKEGLTVYRDQEFSSDMNSRAVQRIEDVTALRRMQFPEDAGPLAHPIRPDSYIEISNFYTVTVYEKGAEIIRMMDVILGKEGFRKGMDLYFDRHDGQAVTCMDFVKCMEDANDADLSQFRLWYEQAGTPVLTVDGGYDANAHTYTLKLRQMTPPTPGQLVKKALHIPVSIGLIGPDGKDMHTQVLNHTEDEQAFTFENVPCPPVLSVLRNFSAPVKVKSHQSDEDLRFLIVNDPDGFNRWEAGQTLALRQIGRMLDTYESKGSLEVDPSYIHTFSELLEQACETDKLLLSKALVLPDIPIIAQERDVVDPSAIFAVRQFLIREIARACHDKLIRIYHEHDIRKPYSIAPEIIAERSLKNIALRYLAFAPENPAGDLTLSLYHKADNMTDRIAALSLMIGTGVEGWEQIIKKFGARFKEFPLVIDKWFALQAMAVRDDTVERVKALRSHPDFNIKNPNRVRSLYSAFAMNNPVNFHSPDGEGYRFLGEAVKELNDLNPSIASRLLTPMRDWRRYTPDRQSRIKEVLEDIAALPGLSRDVYEVVRKAIG